MPERGATVLGSDQGRHVGVRTIVDGPNAPLGDRDADQHRGDGLGHRPRGQTVPIVPRVLIALDQDRIVAREEESRHRMARQVIVDREALALVVVMNGRLDRRTSEPRRHRRVADEPPGEDLVHMAVRAHEEGRRQECSTGADRITVARSIFLGVRTAGVEPRRRYDRGTRRTSVARAGRRRRSATTERNGKQAAQEEPYGDGRVGSERGSIDGGPGRGERPAAGRRAYDELMMTSCAWCRCGGTHPPPT